MRITGTWPSFTLWDCFRQLQAYFAYAFVNLATLIFFRKCLKFLEKLHTYKQYWPCFQAYKLIDSIQKETWREEEENKENSSHLLHNTAMTTTILFHQVAHMIIILQGHSGNLSQNFSLPQNDAT